MKLLTNLRKNENYKKYTIRYKNQNHFLFDVSKSLLLQNYNICETGLNTWFESMIINNRLSNENVLKRTWFKIAKDNYNYYLNLKFFIKQELEYRIKNNEEKNYE